MNNAFLHTLTVLRQVYEERAFSTIALSRALTVCNSRDKALTTKLVYGVLDNDIKLSYIISRYVAKMPKGDVLIILKMGAYCLAELSVPVYAAVNDLAELTKITGDMRQVGFVNATLKNMSRSIKQFDDYPPDEIARLSVMYSYPDWAVRKLVKDYGADIARQIVSYRSDGCDCVRLCGFSQQQAEQKYGVELIPTVFEDAFRLRGSLPSADDCTVQSLSSVAVARVCAALGGSKILDACAAPGGKSVYIKQLRSEAQVTSCDLHPHRVQLIESYAARMNVNLRTECCDMSVYRADFDSAFDVVLCDAPCSGFGVVDSRPDIKLFRRNEDISSLMKVQYAILSNCSRYVAVGGSLVYSTCTVFDNENGQNVRKFLKEHPNFDYGTIVLPQIESADGKPYYQFLPYKDGMQGFFVAVLQRKA